jgi:hypothetical protein
MVKKNEGDEAAAESDFAHAVADRRAAPALLDGADQITVIAF